MIFVSSGTVRSDNIADGVRLLAESGFKNIELSGGPRYQDGLVEILLGYKDEYNLNYVCHNYFPPERDGFVMNLSSLNDEIFSRTLSKLSDTLDISKELGASKFGFHAGYFIDPDPKEMGADIKARTLNDRRKSIDRFCSGYSELKKKADSIGIKLFVENNVLSKANSDAFHGQRPFMLLDLEDFIELSDMIAFNLLLDLGHLKVTSYTLGKSFSNEIQGLIKNAQYLHVSDNDGKTDMHRSIAGLNGCLNELDADQLKDKDITLEVHGGVDEIRASVDCIMEKIK